MVSLGRFRCMRLSPTIIVLLTFKLYTNVIGHTTPSVRVTLHHFQVLGVKMRKQNKRLYVTPMTRSSELRQLMRGSQLVKCYQLFWFVIPAGVWTHGFPLRTPVHVTNWADRGEVEWCMINIWLLMWLLNDDQRKNQIKWLIQPTAIPHHPTKGSVREIWKSRS